MNTHLDTKLQCRTVLILPTFCVYTELVSTLDKFIFIFSRKSTLFLLCSIVSWKEPCFAPSLLWDLGSSITLASLLLLIYETKVGMPTLHRWCKAQAHAP